MNLEKVYQALNSIASDYELRGNLSINSWWGDKDVVSLKGIIINKSGEIKEISPDIDCYGNDFIAFSTVENAIKKNDIILIVIEEYYDEECQDNWEKVLAYKIDHDKIKKEKKDKEENKYKEFVKWLCE